MVDFQLIPKIDYLKTKCYNSNVVNNMIEVENIKYKIVKNYRDAFNKEEFVNNTAKELHKIHKFINNK